MVGDLDDHQDAWWMTRRLPKIVVVVAADRERQFSLIGEESDSADRALQLHRKLKGVCRFRIASREVDVPAVDVPPVVIAGHTDASGEAMQKRNRQILLPPGAVDRARGN